MSGDPKRLDEERRHFDEKAAEYGDSWWGCSTPAGKRRLLRRHEFLDRFLAKLPAGPAVLDIGCGSGRLWEGDTRDARGVGLELSPALAKIARERHPRLRLLRGDVHALPFRDGSVDAAIGDGILHHVDIALALAEIRRVLKPDGAILFFEPNLYNPQIFIERTIAAVRSRHQTSGETALSRRETERLLKQKGWREISVGVFDFLHPATPENLIGAVSNFGLLLEKIPFVREIAGSVVLTAKK